MSAAGGELVARPVRCPGCDPRGPNPGADDYHLAECPYWRTLPAKVVRLDDIATVVGTATPADIVAFALLNPYAVDRSAVLEKEVKDGPQSKPGLDLNIRAHNLAVVNKATPEVMVAIIASILATSADATIAVARIRNEVAGWRFEGE